MPILALVLLVGATGATAAEPAIELVESFPIETPLDHPDIPDAYRVWPQMIASAARTLDLAHFYASNAPDSRLEPVVAAIEDAAARGVQVRFLAEEKFHRTYPETLERLAAIDGVEVRRYDVASLMGGVLHAKYFIIDDREAFVGSQNFDWRALTHIQELGMRLRVPAAVQALSDLFYTDWALAGGADRATRVPVPEGGYGFPATASAMEITPVFSPRDWLPDESLWDLPRLVEIIDGARDTLRVQLLSYRTTGREGGYFDELESAIRRAAARGVAVQMLLADWCKRPGTIAGLQSLQVLPGIDIKLVTIPPWSRGFVPYARVIHAKYMVADGACAWLGTSNWEDDYFYASRNAGFIIRGGAIPVQLHHFFDTGWNGPYAERIDPCAVYTPPRISK